jgi:hypothetical protein
MNSKEMVKESTRIWVEFNKGKISVDERNLQLIILFKALEK